MAGGQVAGRLASGASRQSRLDLKLNIFAEYVLIVEFRQI
jgi:hypothetical protein